MTTIVTRSGKGSSLSWTEADANFTNLNNDKIETSAIGVTIQSHSNNLDSFATVAPTAAGLALLDDIDATSQRVTLGLGNVDNTSDATKNAATVVLTNKTITTPTINTNINFSGTSGVIQVGGIDTAVFTASGVSVLGTNTNDSAATGFVGEYYTAQRTFALAGALVTATGRSVTQLDLPAGDWDVSGVAGIITAATTNVVNIRAWIDTTIGNFTSNTLSTSIVYPGGSVINTPINGTPMLPAMTTRISLATPTTVYLMFQAGFTVAAATCFGTITARRVR